MRVMAQKHTGEGNECAARVKAQKHTRGVMGRVLGAQGLGFRVGCWGSGVWGLGLRLGFRV